MDRFRTRGAYHPHVRRELPLRGPRHRLDTCDRYASDAHVAAPLTCKADPSIALVPVERSKALALTNLFELYAHDFSAYMALPLDEDGRFGVELAETWFTDADHFAYLVREREALVGFALVRRGSELDGARDVMDVAEFFVVRGARRRGVGAKVARALFEGFPGSWEVRVRVANAPAVTFWSRAIEAHTGLPASGLPYSAKGAEWRVFRLDSR